ncbi:MAG TPA: putative peptide modification system cyclase [Xanthomonadales bacterium]|nr:putative peptide modification system cyclase [Xanthomonadales bacterium]
MSAIELPGKPARDGSAPEPLLRTLVLCDIADSTALVERLGDTRAAELMRRHDRTTRLLMHRHGGQEIDKTDGFLILFERPIQAIAFALDYHDSLRDLSLSEGQTLRARVGIHVGDVLVWSNTPDEVAQGAKPWEVEGLAKPVAARLMGLAIPGQTLVTATVVELAKRGEQALRERFPDLQWRDHGRYVFKGVPEPAAVFEVAADARAPLARPPNSDKSKRHVAWWRRPIVLLGEVAAVLAIVTGIAWLSTGSQEAFAFAERDWVVIADLRNLTGQNVLNDSLDAAMHLGLEQSRFVNVLPDLQIRDTLRRMQRPADSPIDRNVAVEIAMREGARAVVLPTADEVGGRVRVSIEVINPANSVTVFSDHADGAGLESVLPSTDLVLKRVRERLGESLPAISEANVPLERVATPNLDALRAYSLGVRALGTGRFDEADELLQRAIELDQQFAAAFVKRATIAFQLGHVADARELVEQAARLGDRLAPRDVLYVDAWRATFGPVSEMHERWQSLAQLYPDFSAAPQNLAMTSWQFENRYDEALEAFQQAAGIKGPLRSMSLQGMGHMLLAQGRVDDARIRFAESREAGLPTVYFGEADLNAMAGRHDDALAMLRGIKLPPNPQLVARRALRIVSYEADRGRLDDAARAALDAVRAAEPLAAKGGPQRARIAAIAVAVASGSNDATIADARALLAAEIERANGAWARMDFGPLHDLAVLGDLAARAGWTDVARAANERISAEPLLADRPVLAAQARVLRARIALASGDVAGAIAIATPLLDGREPVSAHVVLAAAYAASDRRADAAREWRWVATNRGRAWQEWNDEFVAQPMNVLDAALAPLAVAELLAPEDEEAAGRELDGFLQRWDRSRLPPSIERRVREVERLLGRQPPDAAPTSPRTTS